MKRARLIILVLAILVALAQILRPAETLAVIDLALVSMFWWLPTGLLYLLPALVLWKIRPRVTLIGSLAIVFAALNIGASGYNAYHLYSVGQLKGVELKEKVPPIKGPFLLALQSNLSDGHNDCDMLCLRMLLSGSTEAYATIAVENREALLGSADRQTAAIPALTIGSGNDCPGEGYGDLLMERGADYLPFRFQVSREYTKGDADFEMDLIKKSGKCLVRKVMSLSQFETILYVERSSPAKTMLSQLSVRSAGSRTIEALQKRNDRFETVFRAVNVFSSPLALPLSVEPGVNLFKRLNAAMEQAGLPETMHLETTGGRSAHVRRQSIDTDYPYVFTVISRDLGLSLNLPDRSRQIIDAKVKRNEIAAKMGMAETTRRALVLAASSGMKPTEKQLQEFIDSLLQGPIATTPQAEIASLLRASPQSEGTLLKVLLQTLAKMQMPPRSVPADALIVPMADAIGLFSESALKKAAGEMPAFHLTVMQLGALPNLTGLVAMSGESQLPMIRSIVENYDGNFPSAEKAGWYGTRMYRSAIVGLCVLGPQAAGLADLIRKIGGTGMLFLEPNDPNSARTLVALTRMGIMNDDTWLLFSAKGWKREAFDAFRSTTFQVTDCLDPGPENRSVANNHPDIRRYWPSEQRKSTQIRTNF